jgi:4-amino-4-deoxy-L-arabinose transferase-like glycosyltransferase
VYTVEFFGSHIFGNAELYASWMADSVAPILAIGRSPWIFLAIMLVIFVVVRSSNKDRRLFYLLTAWLVIGILPPLVLQNHAFRYYLTYSLPAFAVLCAIGLRALATSIIPGARGSRRLVALILAVNLVLSALYVFKLDEKGFDAPTIDGSNNLLRKGKLVMMTQEFLATEGSSLPQGSTLLFDWLPTMSFGVSIGPSIWCRDSSITVYEVKYAEGRMHLYDPIHPKDVPDIPPLEMGFLLTFHGVKLDMTRLSDL